MIPRIKCENCGVELDPSANFCSICGESLRSPEEHRCPSCGNYKKNTDVYCSQCGTNLQKTPSEALAKVIPLKQEEAPVSGAASGSSTGVSLKERFTVKRILLYGAVAIFVMAAVLAGFQYSSKQKVEAAFLEGASETIQQLNKLNDDLIAAADEKIKNEKQSIEQLKNGVEQDRKEIGGMREKIDRLKPSERYFDQHQALTCVLTAEEALLQQTALILGNPLNGETEQLLISMRSNIAETKRVAEKIQLPDVELLYPANMTLLPDRLSVYVEEKRKEYKEKEARLAENTKFFNGMDAIVQQYNGAKKDLGGMLELVRQGGTTWGEYNKVIQDAKADRSGLRLQVSKLPAPKGTEDIKSLLSNVLSQAVHYCELMEAATKLELTSNLLAQPKHDEAERLNNKIQKEYAYFLQQYQVKKDNMTDFEKL